MYQVKHLGKQGTCGYNINVLRSLSTQPNYCYCWEGSIDRRYYEAVQGQDYAFQDNLEHGRNIQRSFMNAWMLSVCVIDIKLDVTQLNPQPEPREPHQCK